MAAARVMRGEMTMKDLEFQLPEDGRVYGTANPRPYALGRVLGVTDYGDDLAQKMTEETLHLAVVLANTPHGIIRNIDFDEAERMPGVVKVLTAKDVKGTNNIGMPCPHPRSKAGFPIRPVICDKVYRKGDVIASSWQTRENARAAAKYRVDIEPAHVPSYRRFYRTP